MSINLENIEGLTPEQKAAIKAAHGEGVSTAVQKRLKQTEEQEATQAKLDRLAELEEAETKRKNAETAKTLQTEADNFATEGGIKNLDGFKELKVYDKYLNETDNDKRAEMLTELKKSKPSLFADKKVSSEGKNLLGLSGANIDKEKNTLKVY